MSFLKESRINAFRAGAILLVCIALTGFANANPNHKHFDSESKIQDLMKPKAEREQRAEFVEQKLLTFTIAGKNLGPDNVSEFNPKLSMFYKTQKSDFNNQSTEIIRQDRDPQWMTIFKFLWTKGNKETWQFKIKNVLGRDTAVPVSEVKVDVDKFVDEMEKGKERNQYTVRLGNGDSELIFRKSKPVSFKLSATNLAKRDAFGGKSDPYVKCFWSRGPDGPEVEFFRTSWIGNVVDAEWMEIITFDGYQKGTDQYLHFQLYDDDGLTSDEYLGEAYLKLDDSLKSKSSSSRVLELVNEPTKKSGKGTLLVRFLNY